MRQKGAFVFFRDATRPVVTTTVVPAKSLPTNPQQSGTATHRPWTVWRPVCRSFQVAFIQPELASLRQFAWWYSHAPPVFVFETSELRRSLRPELSTGLCVCCVDRGLSIGVPFLHWCVLSSAFSLVAQPPPKRTKWFR